MEEQKGSPNSEKVLPEADKKSEPDNKANSESSTATTSTYATFGARFVAAIVDFFILGIIGYFLNRVVFSLPFVGNQQSYLSNSLLPFIVGIVYFGYMESSVSQATYGKQIMGIKVTDVHGKRVSMSRAGLRYIGKYISSFIFFIGYLFVLFTEKKQALHDLIAGTVVVNK